MQSGLLQRFIIISLLLHGGMLLFWRTTTLETGIGDQPLAVSFISEQVPVAAVAPVPAPPTPSTPPASPTAEPVTRSLSGLSERAPTGAVEQPQIQQAPSEISNSGLLPPEAAPSDRAAIARAVLPSPVNDSTAVEAVELPQPETTHPAVPAAAEMDGKQLQQHIRDTLNLALRDYFVYPRLARRKGWQGEVLLGLHIDHEGRLQDIQVIKSSGHALLDSSAVKALNRVSRISNNFAQSFEMELPVSYQLHEG